MNDTATSLRPARVLCAALGFVLAACAAASTPDLGPVKFSGPPLRLNAQTIEFVDQYRPPLVAPNVDHLLPQTPSAAVRSWATARLQTAGQSGRVRVTIIDARIVAVPLPIRAGIAGAFYDEQETRYDAAIEVSVEYLGTTQVQNAARTRVVRSRTVPESISVNDRSLAWHDMLRSMMDEVDVQLAAGVRQYLAPVLLP